MDLNIHDVIVKPCMTTKAQILNKRLGRVVIEVHPMATKPMIERVLKQLFNTDAAAVRIIVVKGKKRRAGKTRAMVTSSLKKKAIITLKGGVARENGENAWSSVGQDPLSHLKPGL